MRLTAIQHSTELIPTLLAPTEDISQSSTLLVLKEWVMLIGMVAILALIPISWVGLWDIPKMYIVHIVVIACLAIDIISNKKYAFGFVELVLGAFVLWHFLSYTWTAFPGLVWYEAFHWVSLTAIYLVVRNFDFAAANKKRWTSAFMGVMVFNYVILTYFHMDLYIENPWGVNTNYLTTHTRRFLGHNCNAISSLLVITFPLVMYIIRKHRMHPGLATLMLGAHSFFLLICNSRASAIAWLVIGILLLGQYGFGQLKKHVKWILPIVAVSLITFMTIIHQPSVFLRQYSPILSINGEGADDRIDLWNRSLQLLKESPLRGHGSNSWKIQHLKYSSHNISRSYNGRFQYNHAHNFILETGAELGLPGIIALLSLFVMPFLIYGKDNFNHKINDDFYNYILLGFLAFIIISNFYLVTYTNQRQFGSLDIIFISLLGILIHRVNNGVYIRWLPLFILILTICSLSHHGYVHLHQSKLLSTFNNYKDKDPAILLPKLSRIYHSEFFQYNDYVPLKKLESRMLNDNGQTAEAIQVMQEAIALHPYHISNYELLGDMYLQLANLEGAKDSYRKILALNNGYLNARIKLAEVSHRARDTTSFEEALSFYEDWLQEHKEEYYKEDVWDYPNSASYHHWSEHCEVIDRVLELKNQHLISLSSE